MLKYLAAARNKGGVTLVGRNGGCLLGIEMLIQGANLI